MNHDDQQFRTLFESLRQQDQAVAPDFERLLERAEIPVAPRVSVRWKPVLLATAGILLMISVALFQRSKSTMVEAPPNFDQTRLAVQRHFQTQIWSSPTASLLGNQPVELVAEDI